MGLYTSSPTPAAHSAVTTESQIAILTAECDIPRAESDLIVYLVLSLPSEITTDMFLKFLPPLSPPKPSSSKAPLLLAQVCHQWRQIALETAVGKGSSVEMQNLWLSRIGNVPLNYSLPSEADGLLKISVLHPHRWPDVSFGIPLLSFPQLNLGARPLPLLRKI